MSEVFPSCGFLSLCSAYTDWDLFQLLYYFSLPLDLMCIYSSKSEKVSSGKKRLLHAKQAPLPCVSAVCLSGVPRFGGGAQLEKGEEVGEFSSILVVFSYTYKNRSKAVCVCARVCKNRL